MYRQNGQDKNRINKNGINAAAPAAFVVRLKDFEGVVL